jgi:glutamine amidotransferase-like uncharacterized protein
VAAPACVRVVNEDAAVFCRAGTSPSSSMVRMVTMVTAVTKATAVTVVAMSTLCMHRPLWRSQRRRVRMPGEARVPYCENRQRTFCASQHAC